MDQPLDLGPAPALAHDRGCITCGYNLRGIASDGNCPECGTPVAQSMRGDDLRYSDPGWLQRLRVGVFCLFTSVMVQELMWMVDVSASDLLTPWFHTAGMVIGRVLFLAGGLLISLREPRHRQISGGQALRLSLRWLLVLDTAAALTNLVGAAYLPSTIPPYTAPGLVFGLSQLAVSLATLVLLLLWLRRLARRMNARALMGWTVIALFLQCVLFGAYAVLMFANGHTFLGGPYFGVWVWCDRAVHFGLMPFVLVVDSGVTVAYFISLERVQRQAADGSAGPQGPPVPPR